MWRVHSFARDHEYQRHGTLSLLAGIDLLTGRVHARVEDQHRDRRKFGGAAANWLFSRLFSGRGWMRGLDVEAGKDRG